MGSFVCPECGHEQSKTPYYLHTSCFTRCENSDCLMGLEFSSSFLENDLEFKRTYVPVGSTQSPKTGRVLDSHRGYKASRTIIKLASKFQLPYSKEQLLRHRRREGSMKEDWSSFFSV